MSEKAKSIADHLLGTADRLEQVRDSSSVSEREVIGDYLGQSVERIVTATYEDTEREHARMKSALEEIRDTNHCWYETNSPDTYGTGVADGHRCAANMARKGLGEEPVS